MSNIKIDEKAVISLNIKWLWSIAVMCCMVGAGITAFQLKTNYKIEQLYVENQAQHQAIMTKLVEMDNRHSLYVLKQQLEELQVFITRRRDMVEGHTTNFTPEMELELRRQIRDFLK